MRLHFVSLIWISRLIMNFFSIIVNKIIHWISLFKRNFNQFLTGDHIFIDVLFDVRFNGIIVLVFFFEVIVDVIMDLSLVHNVVLIKRLAELLNNQIIFKSCYRHIISWFFHKQFFYILRVSNIMWWNIFI